MLTFVQNRENFSLFFCMYSGRSDKGNEPGSIRCDAPEAVRHKKSDFTDPAFSGCQMSV